MIVAVSLEYDPFVCKNKSVAREKTGGSGHPPVSNMYDPVKIRLYGLLCLHKPGRGADDSIP